MYTIILILHILVVTGLLGAILVQRGRSGGLVEALGGVESIFGTKTNTFFVKLTVILAVLFFCTSISLVYLSREKGKSLMDKYKDLAQQEKPVSGATPAKAAQTKPKAETGVTQAQTTTQAQTQKPEQPQAQTATQEPTQPHNVEQGVSVNEKK